MRGEAKILLLLVTAALGGGCESGRPLRRTASEAEMFGPVRMRLHPVFTRVRDWTGDGRPDGVEAQLEFQDLFGDATKAAGTAIFELFEYRRAEPDPRGNRLVNPWIASLATLQEQREHWNRTSRTYSFQLAAPGARVDRNYVLAVTFEHAGGPRTGRLFNQMVLEAQTPPPAPAQEEPKGAPVPTAAATAPARPGSFPVTQPGGRTPAP